MNPQEVARFAIKALDIAVDASTHGLHEETAAQFADAAYAEVARILEEEPRPVDDDRSAALAAELDAIRHGYESAADRAYQHDVTAQRGECPGGWSEATGSFPVEYDPETDTFTSYEDGEGELPGL